MLVFMILSAIVGVVIQKSAESIGHWLYKEMEGTVKEKLLEKEAIKAIESGDVKDFLKRYEQYLTKEKTKQIKAIALLRKLFKDAEKRINSKKYSEKTANVLINVAEALEEVTSDFPLIEAGIQGMEVEDAETSTKVPIESENYMIALFLRFSASVWTQLAAKLVPEMKGWALEHDAKIRVIVVPPLSRTKGITSDQSSMIQFEEAFWNIIRAYRIGLKIWKYYIKAVACLKSAHFKVKAVETKQSIHPFMNADHLAGLAQAVRGEAFYWRLKLLEDVSEDIDTIEQTTSERIKSYLFDMKVQKEEHEELIEGMKLYEVCINGYAKVLKIFNESVDLCNSGKHEDHIKSRIMEITKKVPKKGKTTNQYPIIEDPDPIL